MSSVTLNVEGMSCGGCEKSITEKLTAVGGVNSVEASSANNTVAIEFDEAQVQQAALEEVIEDAGFDVV